MADSKPLREEQIEDIAQSKVTNLVTDLAAKAPLASPTFTGTVSGVTAAMVGAPSGSGTSSGTNTGDQTTVTGNSGSTDALKSATTTVNVASATAPSTGQVLTATGSTAATWQTPSGGGGSGDVVGPASATDNAIARFDATTGKLIQNSVVTVGDTGDIATTGNVSANTVSVLGAVAGSVSLTATTGGTSTLPAGTRTLVAQDTTDTLTNKNLTSGTNTFPTFNQSTTGSAATLSATNPIAKGGTGRTTSTTAYGLIAAGTTAAGVQQTISPGTSGQFLKSAGGAALAAFASIAQSDVTSLVSDLAAKAPLASPTFTGTPAAPTAAAATNTTQIATTAMVQAAITDAVAATKEALYPVGSYYTNESNSTNPGTLLGFGTWTAVASRMVIGAGAGFPAGTLGGAETHTHGLTAGWAYLDPNGGLNKNFFRQVSTPGWIADATSAGTVASSTAGGNSQGTELGGTTDSGSNMPPYVSAYIWKRTA